MKNARQKYRAGKGFCFFNCLLDGMHTTLCLRHAFQVLFPQRGRILSAQDFFPYERQTSSSFRLDDFIVRQGFAFFKSPSLSKTYNFQSYFQRNHQLTAHIAFLFHVFIPNRLPARINFVTIILCHSLRIGPHHSPTNCNNVPLRTGNDLRRNETGALQASPHMRNGS